jgi:hypothetical protein
MQKGTHPLRKFKHPGGLDLHFRSCTHKIGIGKQRFVMSALPPKADIRQRIEHVCFVPEPDILDARNAEAKGVHCTGSCLRGDVQIAEGENAMPQCVAHTAQQCDCSSSARSYSNRSASIGSIRAAFRAG